MTSRTAPAHPHVTRVAVYPALLTLKWRQPEVSSMDIFLVMIFWIFIYFFAFFAFSQEWDIELVDVHLNLEM